METRLKREHAAKIYARALLHSCGTDVSKSSSSHGQSKSPIDPNAILVELDKLYECLVSSPDLYSLLCRQTVSKDNRLAVMGTLLDKLEVSELTKNTLNIIVSNKRGYAILEFIKQFRLALWAQQKRVSVTVTVPFEMNKKQHDQMNTSLTSALKNSDIESFALDIVVDPTIIGGMIVNMDGFVLDLSVLKSCERVVTSVSG